MAYRGFSNSGHGPTAHGKVVSGIHKGGSGGKAPKGSSSKKSLDGKPHGPSALHEVGKTHASFQEARLAKLAHRGK